MSSSVVQIDPDRMTRLELRAGLSLASIFALRMLGLFLILPVFAVHAQKLPGGDNLTLVGMALGAYGLTQAALQMPFGMASDRYRPQAVIVIGLLMFAAGSFMAACRAGHLLGHRRPRPAGRRRHLGGGDRAGGRPDARAAPHQGDGADRLQHRPGVRAVAGGGAGALCRDRPGAASSS
jgi:hypothetical protein